MPETRLSMFIDDELKAQAKAKAALERVTLTDVVSALLEAWVRGELPTPEEAKKHK